MKNLNITITLTSIAELEGLLDGLDMFCDLNGPDAAGGDLQGREKVEMIAKVKTCRDLAASIRGGRS